MRAKTNGALECRAWTTVFWGRVGATGAIGSCISQTADLAELNATCLAPFSLFLPASPIPSTHDQVMDEIKVLSPSSPSAQVQHPFLFRDSPTSTPSAEERKGVAPNAAAAAAATTTARGCLADAASSADEPRQDHQRQQQPQLHGYRPASPSSPRLVTSPPTPAASAGNTPADTPTTDSQREPSAVASASRLPLSDQLSVVDEQHPSASSSEGGSGVSEPTIRAEAPTTPAAQEEKSVSPPPGGALGASSVTSSMPVASVPVEARVVGGDAGTEADEEAQLAIGAPEGGGEAGQLVDVADTVPGENVSGRGYVGKRFIQAAEVRF